MSILSIDPGCTESAYTLLDGNLKPIKFGKVPNIELLCMCEDLSKGNGNEMAIEMVASYGMAVGQEVFETVFWIGRFWEAFNGARTKVYRKEVKINLCHTMKAKDGNITQALVDRFAPGEKNHGKGVKTSPGWFYGFKADIWQSYACGVTYHDMYLKGSAEE